MIARSLAALLFLLPPALFAQAAIPPARLVLPDTLATTATGKTVGGKPWAYVVLQPSDPLSIRGKSFAVHLRPGLLTGSGSFERLGIVRPVTDVATLKVLVSRAGELGENIDGTQVVARDLATEWKVGNQAIPDDLPELLAMLVNRAAQSEKDALTLRQVAIAHPSIRLALGLAWAGPLPVAAGTTTTLEVREVDAAGADLSVVGRCQCVAGQLPALAAPGPPVQVPDLSPEGDLRIKLRWSVPDPLRRQSLQTTGFRVWRVPTGAVLANPPTLAALEAVPGMKQLTIAPVLLSKLYTAGSPTSGTDVANFIADPSTFFAADDNGRDKTEKIVPPPLNPPHVIRTGVPHAENDTWRYHVAALDWLGQPGAISTSGEGVAVRTIPPPVPSDLQVEEVLNGGSATNTTFRLSFDAAKNNVPGGVKTERYAIYRGDSGPQSLEQLSYLTPKPALPLPAGQFGLPPLATINHANLPRLTYPDGSLTGTGNETKTFWYSVRAIHDTLLGPVYSAPSPPVFATFHDRSGPAAPSGDTVPDCQVTLIREDPAQFVQSSSLQVPSPNLGKGRIIRLKCRRLDPSVTAVSFLVANTRINALLPAMASPTVIFAPGENEVFYDTFWYSPDSIPPTNPLNATRLSFIAAAVGRDGNVSFLAHRTVDWSALGGASSTTRSEIGFECASRATSALETGNALSATRLEAPTGGATFVTTPLVGKANLASSDYADRKAIVRIVRSGKPVVQTLGHVDSNQVLFPDTGNVPGAPTPGFSLQLLRMNQTAFPEGWPPGEPWPPAGAAHKCFQSNQPSAGGSQPTLNLVIGLTTETKEYRVYRQVDNTELSLIAEGIAEYASGELNKVVVADQPNLPVIGRVCYYAQLVDRHGNTSPLKQIGSCIELLAPLPVPVLNTPTAGGNSAAPVMNVEWFCPPAGVKRFRVSIHDETTNTPVVSSPDTTALPPQPAAIYFDKSYPIDVPGSKPTGLQFATNVSPPPPGTPAPEASPLHSAIFNVQLDHEYVVEIIAEGVTPADITRSLPQKFVWRAPAAPGTVAWPSRPLPKVVDGAPYGIVAREFRDTNPAFAAVFASPIQHFSQEETPVLIRLGLMPLTAEGYNSGRLAPVPASLIGSYPVLTPDSNNAFFRGTTDPNAYLISVFSAKSTSVSVPVLPAVLYRQIVAADGRDTTNTGDLVQVSPLVSRIGWRSENGGAAIIDTSIETLPYYSSGRFQAAEFWLADLHPVIIGNSYRYFLVRFGADGEPEQVIDAGTVTPSFETIEQ